MSSGGNKYFDHGSADESDLDNGYDSEAAEITKGARKSVSKRNTKRRKLSHSDDDLSSNSEDAAAPDTRFSRSQNNKKNSFKPVDTTQEDDSRDINAPTNGLQSQTTGVKTASIERPITKPKKSNKKESVPGVVYLSSLPPYLKPSALRNLLVQRGFEPINRLFLTPASKAKSSSKKNSRQLYTEGWIEFTNKKTAKRCAETLNAEIIGGKKGGFYHDDLWNMKYLKGMGWDELMAGIREEKREEEGRRDEERRTIAKETKRFIEGVEEGRRVEGMKRKRKEKASKGDNDAGHDTEDIKRTWRQFEVRGGSDQFRTKKQEKISDDAREVLGKIF